MTIKEARTRVRHIEAVSGDDEEAHWEQDRLYMDALKAIKTGHTGSSSPEALAAEVLAVEDIEFARWYA